MKNGGTEKNGSAMYHDYISDSILRFPAFTPAGNAGYFLVLLSTGRKRLFCVMRSLRNMMRTACVMQTSSVMHAFGAC